MEIKLPMIDDGQQALLSKRPIQAEAINDQKEENIAGADKKQAPIFSDDIQKAQ